MTPFCHSIRVKAEDIDDMNHVNNVVYVRYVQEIAAAHWETIATASQKEELAWVVLRHEIDYKQPAFLDEVLTGETWVLDFDGPKMRRIVVIKNKDEKEVIRACTTWCALNSNRNYRPLRIDQELFNQFLG